MSSASAADIPIAAFKPSGAASDFTHPWNPDQGDGTYRNPVIHADYSDPDVIRVGDDFYLTASSFNCTPGLPILHSVDLINWTIIGHALKNLPDPRYAQVQPGCGVWAPAIRFHNGQFWICFATPDEGIYLVTAGNAAGPWSEPHLVQAGRGLIDPCPFWDDDGQAWLVHSYAGSRAGIKHRLRICPMSADGKSLTGDGTIVFHDPEKHPTLEGPKFLKRDGWYYISAPAGGVENGWQVVLRAKNILGPYEDKIVLAQGPTNVNGPHQGALVDTVEGRWWFVHFQDAGVYGRIVHLQPVIWEDGWPLMGDVDGGKGGQPVLQFGKPVVESRAPIAAPQTSDDFDSGKLGLQWQWQANHLPRWFSLTTRPGWLRLFAEAGSASNLATAPNLLLQKFPARSFVVATRLDCSALPIGGEAGLVVMGRSHAALALRRGEASFQLLCRTDHGEKILNELSATELTLRLQVGTGGVCEFTSVVDGVNISLPQIFIAQAGVWIGAKLGIYCAQTGELATCGHADFAHFHFSPLTGHG